MISLFLLLLPLRLIASVVSHDAIVYFAPEDRLEAKLMEMIRQETQSISICVYAFSHRGIATSLVEAQKRGVAVEIVVDRSAVKSSSPLQRLVNSGVSVYVWNPLQPKKARRPLMHHKFCVFGSGKVWTGSFNFTYEAARIHQENAVVLQDESVVDAYKNQFENLKTRACTPYGAFIAMRRQINRR